MRTVLAVMVALWPLCGLGQGYVTFANVAAFDGVRNGLTGELVPIGTSFQVALYFAQDGIIDESQFVRLGAPTGFHRAGYFSGATRTAPTLTPAGFGMFQVRGWETAYGSTYEQAVANTTPQNGRLALAGKTGIMRVDTANQKDPPATLTGKPSPAIGGPDIFDGFTLYVVPEPSTFFLILAGAVGILLFRRFR